MKPITWEEYYDHFIDWAQRTREEYSKHLTDYGPSDQLTEIIEAIESEHRYFVKPFIERAIK